MLPGWPNDGKPTVSIIYTFVISQHIPKAGMLIEYVNDYPQSSVNYAVYLLVSSCCAPPYLA